MRFDFIFTKWAFFCLGLLTLFLGGCATPSNDVSLKKIAPKERLYLARIQVQWNGSESPKCEIYLNFDLAPSIQLSPDGYLIYKTDRSEINFRSLACYDKRSNRVAAWHHHRLNLEPVLKPEDSSQFTYLGTIDVQWKIDPEQTVEAAKKDLDQTSLVQVGQVKDSGDLFATVQSQLTDAESWVQTKYPELKDKNLQIKENLIRIKK